MLESIKDKDAILARRFTRHAALRFLRDNVLLLISLALILGFGLLNRNVISAANISNIFVQACYLMLFAAAQMQVLLTRGFDLSLGVTVSLVSVVGASVMMNAHGHGVVFQVMAGAVAALLTGSLVGALNGFLIAFLRLNPFVVTLATWNILSTLAATVTGGFPVSGLPVAYSAWLAQAHVLGVPIQVLVIGVVLAMLAWLLNGTVFGRTQFIVGANPRAAELAGMRTRRTLLLSYMLCSLLAAVVAFLLTARTGSGEPNLGGDMTMQSIAAAVVGGVSLRGGHARITCPIVGALFVTIVANGMNLLRVNGSMQQIILGAVILSALILDRFRTDVR